MVVGGLFALLLTDWRAEVTQGFLRLCALLIASLALCTWLVPGVRPAPVGPLTVLLFLGSLGYFLLLIPAGAAAARRLLALLTTLLGIALLVLLVLPGPGAPAN